jgi:hypothetical protein
MAPRYLRRSLAAGVAAVAAAGLVTLGQAPALAACAVGPPSHRTVTPGSATGGSPVAGAKFGAVMATGDFNKDGFADLAVGAPGDKVGTLAAGTVSVFLGSATGLGGTGVRLSQSNVSGMANEAGDQFGASLAAGDFNHDGATDLAVGLPGETIGTVKSGAVAVFRGSTSGLTGGTGYTQTLGGGGNEAGDQFGASLAAGDLNGDGFADLAIGSPGEAPNGGTVHSGLVWVYKGSSSGIVKGWSNTQSDAQGANEAGDKFGAAVAIGNVTGDSHADLVVGAPGEAPGTDPAGSGAIYVVPGAASGKGAGFARTQASGGGTNEAGDSFGASLAVGNLDKDGFADIIVGVPGEAPGSDPAGGAVTVFPGTSGGPTGYGLNENLAGQVIRAGDKFGAAVAAGDVDGDGFADLLVGAPGRSSESATGAGAVYLFGGLPRKAGSILNLNVGRLLAQADVGEADEAGDAFGSAVAFGDLDNNGRAEALVGASGEAPTGQPASGVAVAVSGLVTCGSVPVEQFSRPSAMQAAPVPGASAGALEYAYVDNIGRLVHGHQPVVEDFSSVQWTVISGNDAFSGQPVLAQQPDARLQVVGHNVDSGLWANTQATASPPAWGAWVNEGGLLSSGASSARSGDGKLVVFAVDANGVLWSLPQGAANGPYANWRSLGDVNLVGTPAVVAVSGNGIQVFALDSSGAVQTALYSGGTLSAWTSLGGTGATGTPAVVVYPGFILRVFVRGADGTILTKKQDASGVFPPAWEPVGAAGAFASAGSPSALLDPVSGRTELVARGTDGAVYNTGETRQGSGVWRDWRNVSVIDPSTGAPEVTATDPTLFSVSGGNGSLLAFVFIREDNAVRIYQQVGVTGALAARSEGATPAFASHTLPAPPR